MLFKMHFRLYFLYNILIGRNDSRLLSKDEWNFSNKEFYVTFTITGNTVRKCISLLVIILRKYIECIEANCLLYNYYINECIPAVF